MRLLTTAQTQASSPKEPLFHLDDIAPKLGVTYSELRGLITKHGTAPKRFRAGTGGGPGYYRLSEFRTWHKGLATCNAS